MVQKKNNFAKYFFPMFVHFISNIIKAEPILDIGDMGVFFRVYFLKKRAFCLLAPPKQMPFLTISNGNIFFRIQDIRLGAIVHPSKIQNRPRKVFNNIKCFVNF